MSYTMEQAQLDWDNATPFTDDITCCKKCGDPLEKCELTNEVVECGCSGE